MSGDEDRVLPTVRRTLRDRRLLDRGARVLVGVSGGPDSAALLHVLARLADELRCTLHAASVDHGLRPGSTADVDVARSLADRLGVPFSPLAVRVPTAASVQAEARKVRYAALRRCAERVRASRIAVGHTCDDQAETVLARLLRGASVDGLASIAPRRRDGVVRPLIDCRRADVHRYAAVHGLPRVEDPANRDPRFERVRVRRELLPRLAQEDARIVEHLAALADDARAARAQLRRDGLRLLEGARSGPATVRRTALRRRGRATRRAALRLWLEEQGIAPTRAHLEALEHAVRHGRGLVLLPGGMTVRATAEALALLHEPERPTRSRPVEAPGAAPTAGGEGR
ncbi:MAG: tRNA lysidine(34) synthetase TilS [Sandaracinaceae bacterium]